MWCLLMWQLVHCLASLCNGCSGGSNAMQVAALWHHFLSVMSIGRRLVCASRALVGEVQSPPVIAMAAALCIEVMSQFQGTMA